MSEQPIFVHPGMTKDEYIRMVACQIAFKNVDDVGLACTVLLLERAGKIEKHIKGKV